MTEQAVEPTFARALIESGVTIAVGIIALVVYEVLRTRVGGFLEGQLVRRLETVEKRTAALISGEFVLAVVSWVGLALRLVVWTVVLLVVIQRALVPFAATREIGERLAELVLEPIEKLGMGFIQSVPALMFVVFVIAMAVGGVRLSSGFFLRVETGRLPIRGFYPEWAKPTHRLVSVLIVAAAAIIAYPYIPGSGSDAFKGVTVFVGLLVSLGSSSIIGNLLNGFVITYMRAFKQHDVIQLAGTMGEVVETTLLVTRLRTVEGIEITVPNAQVLAGHVSNFSKAGAPLVSTSVTIGYDVPWRTVEDLLVSAALKVEQVKNAPKPYVLKRGLLDHAIAYELFFAVADSRIVPFAMSRVIEEALDAFNAAGIQIMSPRYVFDPSEPKVVRAGRPAHTPPAG